MLRCYFIDGVRACGSTFAAGSWVMRNGVVSWVVSGTLGEEGGTVGWMERWM